MPTTFPEKLTPHTIGQYQDAMYAEIEEDDLELLATIRAIETGEPFLVHDQVLMSTGRGAEGTTVAVSTDRAVGRIRTRRWELSITLIYALLCEDAIAFPRRGAATMNGQLCGFEACAA